MAHTVKYRVKVEAGRLRLNTMQQLNMLLIFILLKHGASVK